MSRKPLGKQRRVKTSIRIEPDIKKAFEKNYGGLQRGIDALLDLHPSGRPRWLEKLKKFPCPKCGDKSIFRAGHQDCEGK